MCKNYNSKKKYDSYMKLVLNTRHNKNNDDVKQKIDSHFMTSIYDVIFHFFGCWIPTEYKIIYCILEMYYTILLKL